MSYMNENLPCKSLTTEIDNLTENNSLEVNRLYHTVDFLI